MQSLPTHPATHTLGGQVSEDGTQAAALCTQSEYSGPLPGDTRNSAPAEAHDGWGEWNKKATALREWDGELLYEKYIFFSNKAGGRGGEHDFWKGERGDPGGVGRLNMIKIHCIHIGCSQRRKHDKIKKKERHSPTPEPQLHF